MAVVQDHWKNIASQAKVAGSSPVCYFKKLVENVSSIGRTRGRQPRGYEFESHTFSTFIILGVSSTGRASACHAEGYGFESHTPSLYLILGA